MLTTEQNLSSIQELIPHILIKKTAKVENIVFSHILVTLNTQQQIFLYNNLVVSFLSFKLTMITVHFLSMQFIYQ